MIKEISSITNLKTDLFVTTRIYKATLAITVAIQGTKLLRSRRWYRCFSCMFKIMKEEAPDYLINLIPKYDQSIRTRNNIYYQLTTVKQISFSVLFFPLC